MLKNQRKAFVSIVAAGALVLGACGGDDSSSEDPAPETTAAETTEAPAETTEAPAEEPAATYEMNIAVVAAITALPQYVAIAEGMFEANGIIASPVGVVTGPEMGAAMISGDITIAGNIPNNQIGLINAGFDVVAINEIVSSQFFDILVSSNYDLGGATDWKDVMVALTGANVGVVAPGAAADDIARTLFKEAGVDPDAQTYIGTGLPDTTLAAMANGEIDVAISFDPAFVLAEAQGIGFQPFSLRAGEGPSSLLWPSLLGTVSREYAEANPDAVSAYKVAIAEAVQFIQDPANRDRVIEIMLTDMGLPEAIAGPMLDGNIDSFNPTGDFSRDALNAAAEWVFSIGKAPSLLTVDDFTISFG